MKKRIISLGIILTFIFTVFLSNTADSQNGKPTLQIGYGNWSQYMCFYNYYKNNRTQLIYTSSELGAGKIITQLGLNFNMLPSNESARQFTDLKINIKHTSTSEFPEGTTDFEDMTGATQVLFSSLYTLPSSTGVHYFDIDDFMYNGTDNIFVEFVWGQNPDWSSDLVRELCERDEIAPITYRTATGYSDSQTPPDFDELSDFRPNLYLIYEDLPTGTSLIEDGAGTETATISSLIDTQTEATLLNFDFKVTDDGTNPGEDTNPIKISKITIQQAAGNEITDWSEVIGGAILSDGTNTKTSDITINSQSIVIDNINFGIGELGYIADNGQKTYTLNIWLKSDINTDFSDIIDGQHLVFSINPLNGFVLESGSSYFELGQTVTSGNANNEITVTATDLIFSSNNPPASIAVDVPFNVSVKAVDENGNLDLDSNCETTVSLNTGTGNLTSASGLTQNLASGVYYWSDCIYDTEEIISLKAEGCSFIQANSGEINCVNAINIGTPQYESGIPFDNSNENYKVQLIYLSSELGDETTLTHIGFDFTQIAPVGYREFDNLTIKIKNTSIIEFPNVAFDDMSGAQTVFYNPLYNMPENIGWHYFDIDDYEYNGTDNIIIEIVWGDNGGSTPYAGSYRNYGFLTGAMRYVEGTSSWESPPSSPSIGGELVPYLRFRNIVGEISVNEITEESVKLYPNPNSTGVFYIDMNSDIQVDKIQISDITGKIIKEINVNYNFLQINLPETKKGMYFIKIINKKYSVVKRLIIY